MRFKFLSVLALMLMALVPAFAQDANGMNTVTFNGYSASYPDGLAMNANITRYSGDPVDLEIPGGPEAKYTQFDLYSGTVAPEGFNSELSIRFYNTADFAGYTEIESRFAQLQTLLKDRPDLSTFEVGDTSENHSLPFLPVFAAAQVIRARTRYVETPSFTGIVYVTNYRQDASPFLANEFLYTFQGISKDGATYVSVIAKLNTLLFPAEYPADFNYDDFIKNMDAYLADSITNLNQATTDQFGPNPDDLDALVQTISVK